MGQTVTGFCSYCLQLPLLLKAKKGTNPATRCSLSPDIFTKRSQVPSRCCCCCGTKAEVWALATLCGLRLFHSRWTEVNSTVRSAVTGLRAACSLCQSPASTLTGPQTPVDSTPTFSSIAQATSCQGNLKNRCVCLSDETNSVLLFFLLAHQFILHSCVYSWIHFDIRLFLFMSKDDAQILSVERFAPVWPHHRRWDDVKLLSFYL